jgi:cellulose synthase/poly-beta-1,6-N-acetylglucosamine synthase-like glycosyltransferase
MVLGYYAVANAVYLLLLVISFFVIARHLHRLRYGGYRLHPSTAPAVSILMSAYNEENGIVDSVRALFHLDYPFYEIIVVNDGSTDSTLEKLSDAFGLRKMDLIYRPFIPTARVSGFYTNPEFPNLTVVDKEHSGKADSLNAGINTSRYPYFCSIDADSILEKSALVRLMRPIVEEPEIVKATGGIIRIINGSVVKKAEVVRVGLPGKALSRFQAVEYIRSFLFGRTGWSAMNSLLIISGTFSMFHKKSVVDVGGYNAYTVAEDMELVVKLHRHLIDSGEKYRIVFVPDPICWTEVPEDLRMLARQRRRWHTGLAESIYAHRRMLFNPLYGRIGLLALPYHFAIELFGPLIEVAGYFVIVYSFFAAIIDVNFFLLFLTMAIMLGVLLSIGAVLLEEITYKRYPSMKDLLTLIFYGFLENFGYRQINSLWRTEALIKLIFRGRKGWEYVEKRGFQRG